MSEGAETIGFELLLKSALGLASFIDLHMQNPLGTSLPEMQNVNREATPREYLSSSTGSTLNSPENRSPRLLFGACPGTFGAGGKEDGGGGGGGEFRRLARVFYAERMLAIVLPGYDAFQ